MEVVWAATFCVISWVSGSFFGAWVTSRRKVSKGRRRRNAYFEEESDRWRPLRRVSSRFVSLGIAITAFLLALAIAYILALPKPHDQHENLRGRVAMNLTLGVSLTAPYRV